MTAEPVDDRVLSPRRLVAELASSPRFAQRVARLVEQTGRPAEEIRAEAVRDLAEMTAGQRPTAVDAWTRIGRWMARAYRVDADTVSLARLRELDAGSPLVFLPNHRSYLDPLVLRSVLAGAGFPPNYVLGGVNLAFFPMGSVARRSNIVFIRRQFKDDPVYRSMLRMYLGHLVREGANLEWYIEGGRTRTGKLRPPRMGILSYLLDAFAEAEDVADVHFVPVSIVYDQQHEVGAIAAEESGGTKAPESVRWLVDFARAQSVRRGTVHVRFADPVSLRATLAEAQAAAGSEDVRAAVPRVAIEVAHRINQVTPVTAPALVTLGLLDTDDVALTESQLRAELLPILEYVRDRRLPVASGMNMADVHVLAERVPSEGRRALDTLVRQGVVKAFTGGAEPVYLIPPERALEAAFYRNTVSHSFVNRGIVELGLVAAAEREASDVIGTVWDEALALRDLLKFEYFFSSKRDFAAEVREEAGLIEPSWQEDPPAWDAILPRMAEAPFLIAHRVLGPFLEAYAVMADLLARLDPRTAVDRDRLVADALGLAQQRVLQRSVHSRESVSKDLMRGALQLADNRGLLEPGGEDLEKRRAALAVELAEAVRRVDVVRRFATEARA